MSASAFQDSRPALPVWFRTVLLVGVLWALIGVGHYSLSDGFGIYTDDVFVTGHTLTGGMDYALERTLDQLRDFSLHGRPLTRFVPHLLSAAGVEMGGLHGAYMMGMAVFCLLALLMFTLLRRAFDERIAFVATAVFIFFPADVNKAYLMHSYLHWPTLCLALGALHLYLSGWRVAAFGMAALCLFYYEPGFLPFFAAPLLVPSTDRPTGRRMLLHVVLCFALIAAAVAVRKLGGDFRMSGEHAMVGGGITGLLKAGMKTGTNLLLGPLTALGSFPYAVMRFMHHASQVSLTAAGAGLALTTVGLTIIPRHGMHQYKQRFTWAGSFHRFSISIASPLIDANLLRALRIGTVLLMTGYLFSFTIFPAIHLWGRATRVHYAAGMGAALLVGALLIVLHNALTRKWGQFAGHLPCALLIGLLCGYAFHVQGEYVQNWRDQSWLLSQTVSLAPDAGEDTRIFVIDKNLPPNTRSIASFRGWNTPVMHRFLFDYPKDWNSPPRVFIKQEDWKGRIRMIDGIPHWKRPTGLGWWTKWVPLPEGNLIILEMKNGALARKTGTIPILGRQFRLKPITAPVQAPHRPLFEELAH